MKKITHIPLSIILMISFLLGKSAFSQGEANWWYFGQNAGLHFNGGVPVAVTNGQLNTTEGCASISDAAGNLLFYTDGITVWNSNHVQMPNGFGLMGGTGSSTQSALIIQKPGSATIYYIFTADELAGGNGIRYTEVDMWLNAGLGDVTANKNILLNTPSCEKLTAIRHCNNQDVWIVTHDWNSDAFRSYLVTSTGINPAVISNAGLVVSGSTLNTQGQLKGSPNGKKLASTIFEDRHFELFDFNNSTGIVSNAILFPQFPGYHYGVEFSQDGTKMYGAHYGTGRIYQFDLCKGSNTAIANSGVLIGTSSGTYIGALELGPDKKIYVARHNVAWVGVINSPNNLGSGCNYVDNGVSLAGQISSSGLPNFVPWYFKPPLPSFTVSVNCLTGAFTTPTVNITNCSGSTSAIVSVSWDFGDTGSGANNTSILPNPTHTFTGAGTYTITLVLNYACGNDTIRQNVTTNSTLALTTSSTQTDCIINNGTATAIPNGGISPYTYNWSNGQTIQTSTGLGTGTYTVAATDVNGCSNTQTVTVTSFDSPSITAASTQAGCIVNNGTATAIPNSGTNPYTYNWNNGQTTQTATGLAAGVYCCTITDAYNCSSTACIAVDILYGDLFVPNAFSPNNDRENDEFCLQGGMEYCIKDLIVYIYNRWGEKVFQSDDPAFCWNGTYKGKSENPAVFIYYIKATLSNEKEVEKKGNVSLIR